MMRWNLLIFVCSKFVLDNCHLFFSFIHTWKALYSNTPQIVLCRASSMPMFSSVVKRFSLKRGKGTESGKDASSAERRIKNELRGAMNSPPTHISYGMVGKDWSKLQGAIMGPSDTPFEGGVFFLSIKLPADYPHRPPKFKFKTKIFHPNISSDGTVHIDILGKQWSPVITIEKMLLSICSILPDANPEDSFNPASILYVHNKKIYYQKARKWTFKYAC